MDLCGATDGLSYGPFDDPYGKCDLPAGHEGDWHREMRDGRLWASWRGPHPDETCRICGKKGSEH